VDRLVLERRLTALQALLKLGHRIGDRIAVADWLLAEWHVSLVANGHLGMGRHTEERDPEEDRRHTKQQRECLVTAHRVCSRLSLPSK